MPQAFANARLDRKLTDFFTKKPKTGPRPDQPIYDISSSSERQSIISISSDDVPIPSKASQSAQTTRVKDNIPSSLRRQGSSNSGIQVIASSSRSSGTQLAAGRAPPSSSGLARTSSKDAPVASKPHSKTPTPTSPMAKKNSKKRKQQPINLITSEESDDPVLPSIYVNPLSKKSGQRESKSKSSTQISTPEGLSSSAAVPLAPRQNLLSPSKRSSQKSDVTTTTSTPLSSPKAKSSVQPSPKASIQSSRNYISATPTRHRPSPPKRPRLNSASASDKPAPAAPDCDADDESENQIDASPRRPGRRMSQSAQHDKPLDVGGVILVDHVAPMDVDPTVPPSSSPPADNDSKEGNASTVVFQQITSTVTPRGDAQEILPSSQQGENELHMDDNTMDVDAQGPSSPTSISVPLPPQLPFTPSKARTNDIIARIKAKADADAAAQAHEDRKLSSLGFGEASDLSSLSSLDTDHDDEDEGELELELSAFGKGRTGINKPSDPFFSSAFTSANNTYSSPPTDGGTRRSTRHVNVPAPNYAKKIELFRDNTPPSSGHKGREGGASGGRAAKTIAKVVSCPLDMLLKDREREGARKARVETKRKGVPMADSESVVDPGSSVFETPPRGSQKDDAKTESPGSDISSVQGDVFSADGDAVMREELLGKKSAKAVGMILDGDRRKRVVEEMKESDDVVCWSRSVQGGGDVVPSLVGGGQTNPFSKVLGDAIDRKDYTVASLLLDSGALASVPLSAKLLGWLFSTALTTANPYISQSAYHALLVLHREIYSTEVMARTQLTSNTLLAPLFKLGVDAQVYQLLCTAGDDFVSVVAASQEVKVEMVCRFVTMLEVLGRSQGVEPTAMPSIVSVLLLLALNPSAVPELQQDVVCAIEAILGSPGVTRALELSICKFVIRVTTSLAFTPDQQARLLGLLSGCSSSSGRVRRWIAWAMLGGDLNDATIRECQDVPPIELMHNLFKKDVPGVLKLEVTRDTDYELLGVWVDMLSVAMTEVEAYARRQGGLGLTKQICEALEQVNGKIVDTRAAHLDRTRTKDAINRLHKRLVYQHHAAREHLRAGNGTLNQFFIAKPKSTSTSKPKPKPLFKDS